VKPSVYVESSVVSYLTARPSRLLIVRAHQQVTRRWWRTARERFRLHISELVLEELRQGDAAAARRRLEVVEGLTVLGYRDGVPTLVREYQRLLRVPVKAVVDLTHVGLAVAHEMDYLVTWNCAHIANAEFVRKIVQANQQAGRFMPMIATPEELLGQEEGDIS
jgi:hypothetical protein